VGHLGDLEARALLITTSRGADMGWDILIGVAVAIAVSWVVLIIALAVVRPRGPPLTEALRILPDLLRLLRRLAADRTLPRGVRIRLGLLLAYLAFPIDLIPDFIPCACRKPRPRHATWEYSWMMPPRRSRRWTLN
jgi:hypothetical protein